MENKTKCERERDASAERLIRYINERETSLLTGMALSTLRNHRHLGKGLPYSKIGRSVRYQLQDILGFMESRKIQTEN